MDNCHEGGLPTIAAKLDIQDRFQFDQFLYFQFIIEIKVKSFPENLKNNRVGQVLAEEKPHWPEDCKREYHAMTRGFHPVLLTN